MVAAGILTFNVAYLFVLTGTVSLFRSFLGAPSRLFPRWAIFLGRISYGLYLFNLLSVFLVRPLVRNRVPISIEVLLTLLANIALAVASWYLLEKPFLRLKARIAYPRTASFIRD